MALMQDLKQGSNNHIFQICNNSYNFKIFWKASIANVQIKPNQAIAATHIAVGVFKGFLSCKICREKYSEQNGFLN